MSRPALAAAAIYAVLGAAILLWDSRTAVPGAWISVKNVTRFLVTFPVSAPLEMIGALPDLGNPLNVILLLAACTVLVYYIAWAIARLFT